jgi:DNA polymerase III alpha subunit
LGFRVPERGVVRVAAGRREAEAEWDERYGAAKNVAQQYQDIFGKGNFYLEIQDQGLEQESKIHEALFRLERELGIPLVLTNDSHYLCGEDSHAHDVMLCVQTGAKVHDKERFRFDSDQFFVKSADEMGAMFKDSPGCCSGRWRLRSGATEAARGGQSVSGVCGAGGAHDRQLL